MILTVTPAPALDLTLELDQVVLGAVNRSDHSEREASGKGVNVSWALHRAGIPTLALYPAGGSGAGFMTSALEQAGMPQRLVPIEAELRTNVTLRPHLGHETKVNSPGSPLTSTEITRLLEAIDDELTRATDMCLCGSAPTGAPENLMPEIISLAKARGVRTLVDTSGKALDAAIQAAPEIVTPNLHELYELTHHPLDTLGAVEKAASMVRERGIETVVVTLGASGAMLVDSDGALWARAKGVQPRNSVGAGDALLAGFVSARDDTSTMLATAVWWASSAVESLTTLFTLNPALRESVKVSREFNPETTLQ